MGDWWQFARLLKAAGTFYGFVTAIVGLTLLFPVIVWQEVQHYRVGAWTMKITYSDPTELPMGKREPGFIVFGRR